MKRGFDLDSKVAFRVSEFWKNIFKEKKNIMNDFLASTSKTRGVWTVSLPYGVSQKPQSTNNLVNHFINTKQGKDKACDHLHSLLSIPFLNYFHSHTSSIIIHYHLPSFIIFPSLPFSHSLLTKKNITTYLHLLSYKNKK